VKKIKKITLWKVTSKVNDIYMAGSVVSMIQN